MNAALGLARRARKIVDVTLVTEESWFDYKPCIYRVVAGMPPFSVYVPLERIFRGTGVKIIVDPMRRISLRGGYVECASGERHPYDYLVIALGSEVDFHGVPVLKPITFSANSLREAIRLSLHVDEVLSKIKQTGDPEGIALGHFVIVGGGPTGVEMAAAISNYARRRASAYGVDPSMITVDLIDSGSRVLKRLSTAISVHAHTRLRDLDVNIYYNRRVMEEHVEEVYFRDMHFKTATIVWTAGVTANRSLLSVEGAEIDKEGRLLVDHHLRLRGRPNVFAIGDAVPDPYYGLAQTAIAHGRYVASEIDHLLRGREGHPYMPRENAYAVPVGPGWAAVQVWQLRFYGRAGWLIRRLGDLRFFASILPPFEALRVCLWDGVRTTLALADILAGQRKETAKQT